MSDSLIEIYKTHAEAGHKYTYFLLTAAGAGIGLIFQKTDGASFSRWLLPAGLAALFWGLSFFLGCLSLRNYRYSIDLNYQMLEKSKQGASKGKLAEGGELFDKYNKKASSCSNWQFNMLILGAICLVAWRLTEMTQVYLEQPTLTTTSDKETGTTRLQQTKVEQ